MNNNRNLQSSRDLSIDILRWLALTGIILVHIQPSPFWSQLRSFDVPMMVFLSAYCFAKEKHGVQDYKVYCIKRFKRLVLPCWIFLTGWFTFVYGILGHPADWKNVLLCYSLMTSWYLWIIRIFVTMALVAPLVTKRIRSLTKRVYFIMLLSGIILNEILCDLSDNYLYMVAIMSFSYFLVFMFGLYIDKLSNKQILTIGGGAVVLFALIAWKLITEEGSFVLVGKYKYPPHLYYLSYAFSCIIILWMVRKQLEVILRKVHLLPLVTYIGSHTLWIYLWHIPLLSLVGMHFIPPVRFLIVYVSAILLSYIQTSAVTWLCTRLPEGRLGKNLKIILIG